MAGAGDERDRRTVRLPLTDATQRSQPGESFMRNVYVLGIGMTRFAKQPEQTLKALARTALEGALADADIERERIEAVYFGNAVAGSITGQEMVAGQVCLRAAGIDRIPVFNVENACASASTALHLASQAVASGQYDLVLAVGAEKMTHPDTMRSFNALLGALDVESPAAETVGSEVPFMSVYAADARRYMEESGATQQDFAAVAVKNQRNGSFNPLAQYGGELSVADVLSDREIVWPLTLRMCAPISDGAAAAILGSDRWTGARPGQVRIAASVVRSGVDPSRQAASSSRHSADRAYESAGIGPNDVSVAEVHDAAASAELRLYEELRFAEPGGGVALIRDGGTVLGGTLPVNPSGGLLARGHPIGATGLAQVHELVLQLRGQAGPRQVTGARVGLAHNAGGYHRGDNLAAVVHILVR